MDLDALRVLMVPDMGASIDVPHQMTLGRGHETALSNWVPSADPRDRDEDMRNQDIIFGRIVKIHFEDEYGEPIGKPDLILQHKADHPKRKSKDISASTIRPRTMAGEKDSEGNFSSLPLRKRFPQAFEEFERRLRREGSEFPIALLDKVPPEIIETLIALGIDSVQAFAEAGDDVLDRLRKRLESDKYAARVPYVTSYQDRAKAYLGVDRARELAGIGADELVHRGPGRPRKLAN